MFFFTRFLAEVQPRTYYRIDVYPSNFHLGYDIISKRCLFVMYECRKYYKNFTKTCANALERPISQMDRFSTSCIDS